MIKIFKYCNNLIKQHYPNTYIYIYLYYILLSIINLFSNFSVIPLITVLISPEIVREISFFKDLEFLKECSDYQLKIIFSSVFLSFIFVSQLMMFVGILFQSYLSKHVTFRLAHNLYSKTFNKGIQIFLSEDSSRLNNTINGGIENVGVYLNNYLDFWKNIITLSAMILGVVLIEPKTFFGIFLILFFYYILYSTSKNFLKKNSYYQFDLAKKISDLKSIFGIGFREVIILGIKKKMLNLFLELHKKYLKNDMYVVSLLSYPRYLLEIFLYLFIVLYFFSKGGTLLDKSKLPYYAFFFLSLWRSIPITFNLYKNLSSINSKISSHINLDKLEKKYLKLNKLKIKKIVSFSKEILIKDVNFNYPNSDKKFNFNYKIKKGDKILVVANSGKGKTTLFNLITGLLKPNSGKILIDKNDIAFDPTGAAKIISYITQINYFFSDTISGNITFKKKLSSKDIKDLKIIYDICGLSNILKNYDEIFVRRVNLNAPELSGGQRQRIAIARSLYRKPDLIIFDESMNALDKKSEIDILKKIFKYYPKITILVSSHRPIKKLFTKIIKF
jgi:ABC-type multidrug transport system fused ATPase/permease subunit